METMVNIPAILVANTLGIMVDGTILLSHPVIFSKKNKESLLLRTICGIILLACVVDPIVFLADGHPGKWCRVAVFGGNALLLILGVVIGMVLLALIQLHLKMPMTKTIKILATADFLASPLLVTANFFKPLIFIVSDDNVYQRGEFFWVFVALESALIWLGIIIYIITKRNGGMFKFFPVWQFLAPAGVGMAIQSVMYGVSTIWPTAAISLLGIVTSFQNEAIYQDQLTGTYNHFYFMKIERETKPGDIRKITAFMLDVNGFKKINDEYGHLAGDEALKDLTEILNRSVGKLGTVIRYAGDEFVIFLNTQKQETVDSFVNEFYSNLEEFNARGAKPYLLSVSMGSSAFDLKFGSMTELIEQIDSKMYENKREYYSSHSSENRRAAQ